MEKIEVVNNWKASKYVTEFHLRYCVQIKQKVLEAQAIMDDKTRRWESEDQRAKAQLKLDKLDTQNIDFHTYYSEVSKLVDQHEQLVSSLTEMYSKWYHNISYKGKQPKEMMDMQVNELQEIFIKLYEVIEPLKLEIKPPEGYKTEKNA